MIRGPAPSLPFGEWASRLLAGPLGACYARPRACLALLAAATLASLAVVARLEVTSELAGHLGGDPALEDDRRLRAWFPGAEGLVLLVPVADPGCDGADLERLRALTVALRVAPGVQGVISAADLLPKPPGGGTGFGDLARGSARLAQLLALVDRSRFAEGFLHARSGRWFGLLVATGPCSDPEGRRAMVEGIMGRARGAFPARGIVALGYPVTEQAILDRLRQATQRFIPVALVGGLAVLFLFVRRLPWVAAAALATASPLLWMLAAMGMAGEAINPVSTLLFPVILSISLSATFYIFFALAAAPDAAPEARERAFLVHLLPPQVLCNLTTCLGFLSLAFTRTETLVRLGWWAALGIVFALLAPLLVLPCAGRLLARPDPAPAPGPVALGLERRLQGGAAWRLGLALAALATLGVVRLRPASSDRAVLLADDPLSLALATHEAEFGWRGLVEVCVRFADYPADHPRSLEKLARLAGQLQADPRVQGALSWYDVQLDVGSRLAGRRLDAVRTRSELGDYRRLLGPDPGLAPMFLSRDGVAARLFVTLRTDDAFEIVDLAGTRDRLAAALGPGDELFFAGEEYLAALVHHRAVTNSVQSFLFSVVTILGVILVVFRSLGACAVLAVANLIPLAVVYGLMGWAGIPLDIGGAILGPVLLGIVVDDTIHLIHRTRMELAAGAPRPEAAARSLASVGPAVVATSLTMAAGMLLSALTPLAFSRRFGGLACLTLLIALAVELVVTPRLLATLPVD